MRVKVAKNISEECWDIAYNGIIIARTSYMVLANVKFQVDDDYAFIEGDIVKETTAKRRRLVCFDRDFRDSFFLSAGYINVKKAKEVEIKNGKIYV